MKTNYMLLSAGIFFCSLLPAQNVLYTENFNGPSHSFILNTSDVASVGSSNSWMVNNSYTGGSASIVCLGFPFSFTVNNTTAQPAGITGSPASNYLHICAAAAASSGVTNSNYQAADGLCTFDESYFAKMSNDISTLGQTNVSLNFWWLCDAEQSVAYGEVYYSTDGGMNWNLVSAPEFSAQPNWTQQTLTNAGFNNQATLRFGFRFVNSTSGGTAADPPFSIDDIQITGTNGGCTPTNASFSASGCHSYTVPSGDETYTAAGTYMDTIPNAAGCDSIMTIQVSILNTAAAYSVSTCGSYASASGTTYTVSGTYMDTIPNAAGCDSILTIQLTIQNLNTALHYDGLGQLYGAASNPGATYQWVDCNNGYSALAGETDSLFSPSSNGSYAVIISNGICTDTSACATINYIGLRELNAAAIRMYPNPVSELLYIELTEPTGVTISNMLGQTVFTKMLETGQQSIATDPFSKGIYFVTFSTASKKYAVRIVKE